jgi:DNA-binding response OmpR family regulator
MHYASGKSESKERIKLGAQDYLTKPFNPEELDELLRKICIPFTMP